MIAMCGQWAFLEGDFVEGKGAGGPRAEHTVNSTGGGGLESGAERSEKSHGEAQGRPAI